MKKFLIMTIFLLSSPYVRAEGDLEKAVALISNAASFNTYLPSLDAEIQKIRAESNLRIVQMEANIRNSTNREILEYYRREKKEFQEMLISNQRIKDNILSRGQVQKDTLELLKQIILNTKKMNLDLSDVASYANTLPELQASVLQVIFDTGTLSENQRQILQDKIKQGKLDPLVEQILIQVKALQIKASGSEERMASLVKIYSEFAQIKGVIDDSVREIDQNTNFLNFAITDFDIKIQSYEGQ